MTVTPGAPLDPNASYTLQLNDFSDLAGNQLVPVSFGFATGSTTVPNGTAQLISTSPAQGS